MLHLPAGVEIAADPGRRLDDLAAALVQFLAPGIGDAPADLDRPARQKLAIGHAEHRRDIGIDVAGKRQILVWRDCPQIGDGNLAPQFARIADIRRQEARLAALEAVGVGKARQGHDGHAEHLQPGARVEHTATHRVMNDLHRLQRPDRIDRAAFLIHDRAG